MTSSYYYENKFDAAHTANLSAIKVARELLHREPDEPTSHMVLSEALCDGAMIAAHQYRNGVAEEFFEESISILEQGQILFPEYIAFQSNLLLNPQRFERAKQGAALGSKVADLEVAPYEHEFVVE